MRNKGTFWILLGVLFIAAAVLLTGYNVQDETRAEESSKEILTVLVPEVENIAEDPEDVENIPDYQTFSDMEMPVKEVKGNEYIGVLEIVSKELVLPVMSEWSYPKLKISPCRYSGSAYKNDMIICAHNYSSHFGGLKSMVQGEQIKFTDVDGNEFLYEVAEIEILDPYATMEITEGDWDLTLFTCTYGGRDRVTVRCILTE